MHDSKFSAMQEAYDSRLPEEYDEYQTQEEIDSENDQEYRYNKLIEHASDMNYEATQAFIDFMIELNKGNKEQEKADYLLGEIIEKAADYNGSEATVPDFVRLVRMAFEWKSKQ